MKLFETGSFPIADIDVGKRLRMVDDDWAKGLAATIEATGLQHPVQVMKIGNSHRLIAGAHRIRAFQLLGRTDIEAKVYEPETDQPELELRRAEIVENIGRRDLSALDRAAHIAELAEIERSLVGETRGRKKKEETVSFFSLSGEVASKMGLSDRTIRADLELHRGLSAATRKRVAGTWLAEQRNQLRDLSRLEPEQQSKALDLMLAEEPKAKRVADAVCIIEKRPKAEKNTRDGQVAKIVKIYADLDSTGRKHALLQLQQMGVRITDDAVKTGASKKAREA